MIFENPDELGYFTQQQKAKGKPPAPSAMDLRAITGLTLQEATDIEAAAINAHEGHDLDAERCRGYAGYGNVGFRPDADIVR